eukprot:1417757-Pyramimonas_sp.AAC.1
MPMELSMSLFGPRPRSRCGNVQALSPSLSSFVSSGLRNGKSGEVSWASRAAAFSCVRAPGL